MNCGYLGRCTNVCPLWTTGEGRRIGGARVRPNIKYGNMGRKGGGQRITIDEVSGRVSDGGEDSSYEPDGDRGQDTDWEDRDGDLPGYTDTPEDFRHRDI